MNKKVIIMLIIVGVGITAFILLTGTTNISEKVKEVIRPSRRDSNLSRL